MTISVDHAIDRALAAAAPAGQQEQTSTTRATDAQAKALLSLMADLPAGPDRDRVRSRLIELYIPLAEYLARRFRNRGEQFDDLVQVANLGLIKSVDGFDPARGAAFTSYAIPMIVGELKRHFRDKGWDVRVPRRLQELRLEISKVSGPLAQDLGRSPTVADLAARLSVSEEEIIEGLDCGQAYRALSLDAPAGDGADPTATGLGDLLGGEDPDIQNVENREALRPLLARLPQREQKIIAMRFHGNLTQSQIAAELGISQMHVSRLLAGALRTLRTELSAIQD
ncbi:RNA polymerase sigma factor SigF [Dactylosporangium sp. AC04546]|uniref:RNA polymerase sigma factor SigF n=1 Tax=Dactylosporangium sp. AC04546 TaxID=2862460 RepID=UPI001EDD7ABE|nr:RNA polymerase sigma factor SigF [Dactylosporangium sp. AC04546]WVK84358.1 RNA polymerase sigma factor SigF [Dactylosporangium sp. AC04546]